MRQSYVRAAMPLFGGKATVVPQLFKAVETLLPRSEWSQATFVEAFTGSAVVGLAAKRHGFLVTTNDLASRAVLSATALVLNDRTTLTVDDELRLHAGHPTNDGRLHREFSPRYLLPGHAAWLDGALAAARAVPDETKRALMLLLLIHAIGRIRPFNDWSRTAPTEAFAVGDIDAVRLSVGGVKRMLMLTPHGLIAGLRERLNRAVFFNGRTGHRVSQMDATEFVGQSQGEIMYADPPYMGSSSYEATFKGIDMILEGRTEPRPTSVFNSAGALAALDGLLEAAAHFPAWLLSFGGGRITHAEFLARVRRHRPAELAPIELRYRTGTAIYGDSGAAREILVVARRAR